MADEPRQIEHIQVLIGRDTMCAVLSLTDNRGIEYQLDLGYHPTVTLNDHGQMEISLESIDDTSKGPIFYNVDEKTIENLFWRKNDPQYFGIREFGKNRIITFMNDATIQVGSEWGYNYPRIVLNNVGLLIGNAPSSVPHKGTTIYIPKTGLIPSMDMPCGDFNGLFDSENAADLEHKCIRRIFVDSANVWKNWDEFTDDNELRDYCGRPKTIVLELRSQGAMDAVLDKIREAKIPYKVTCS